MKILNRILPLAVLAAICAALLAIPVAATTSYSEYDGLQVTIEMDKDRYSPGEPITATITVENTTATTMTIANLEQLIPQGYTLESGSEVSMMDVEMWPGRVIVLQVTFTGEPTAEASMTAGFFDKLLYGETLGIPNLLLAVLLTIAFVVFMILT